MITIFINRERANREAQDAINAGLAARASVAFRRQVDADTRECESGFAVELFDASGRTVGVL